MVLILKKKESGYRRWYAKNKESLSEKRKKRYAEDPQYRERQLESSRRYRRGERTPKTPPDDAPISFGEAAERIGVSGSTLHEWRRKGYFPEPKHQNGRVWFSDRQILLLGGLKEVIRVYGKRRGKVKQEQLDQVRASISAGWN